MSPRNNNYLFRYKFRKTKDMFRAVLSKLTSGEWLRFIGRIFRVLPMSLPFDALNEGISRAVGFIFGTKKLEWPGYNLVKVAWWSTQSFWQNTSTSQTHTYIDIHVAIGNAVPTANALRRDSGCNNDFWASTSRSWRFGQNCARAARSNYNTLLNCVRGGIYLCADIFSLFLWPWY